MRDKTVHKEKRLVRVSILMVTEVPTELIYTPKLVKREIPVVE